MAKPQHSFRAPTSAATAFVEANSTEATAVLTPKPEVGLSLSVVPSAKAASTHPASSVGPSGGRKTCVRSDGREMRKQTIYLEAGLSKHLAIHCASNGVNVSDVVAAALESHLK